MSETSSSRRFRVVSLLGVSLWCLLVLGVFFWPRGTLLDRVEWRTVDWRFHVRGQQQPRNKIIIVAVDEESINRQGRWPWRRDVFAELVRRLDTAGARQIVFDVFFTEPDGTPGGAASDAALASSTRRAGNVFHAGFIYDPGTAAPETAAPQVAARAWEETRVQHAAGLASVAQLIEPQAVTFPLPELAAAAAGFGVANVVGSGDGVYRYLVPLVRYQERLYPSVALAVAARDLGLTPAQVTVTPGRGIALGDLHIPLDMQGRLLIDFLGPDHTFEYVSVAQVMRQTLEENRDLFRDKIVLVGVTAPGIYDLRASPFDAIYNGVEAQASAIDAILSRRFIEQTLPWQTALVVLSLVLIFGLLLPRLPATWMTALGVLALVSYPWMAVNLFIRQRLLIELVAPTTAMLGALLIIVILRLLIEERRRHQVQTVLRHFVPPQLVGRLVEDEALMTLRGERREISVFFADIRNFTATAEVLAPEDTVTFLNRYFNLIHEVIWEHEGTLDKYIGDEIMVFYNAPVAQADHARRAVMTAIDIQRRISANQAEWEYLGVQDLAAGIGIASGQAVVGYVGSSERMQYTVIGQTVNLASRLQALCKKLGCRILISDATYQAVADLIVAQDLGEMPITGLQLPVRVWHVLDYREEKLRGQWAPVGVPVVVQPSAQTSEDAV